jgi:hypothetical protein
VRTRGKRFIGTSGRAADAALVPTEPTEAMWFAYLHEREPDEPVRRERRSTMNDLVQQAEALLAFSADLEQRLTGNGMTGVAGLFERFRELCDALSQVDAEELRQARRQIHELVETLTGVAEQLDQLEAIKQTMPASQ